MAAFRTCKTAHVVRQAGRVVRLQSKLKEELMKMAKKVMLIMANNCEEGEVCKIINVMRRVGFQCDGVSTEGKVITG